MFTKINFYSINLLSKYLKSNIKKMFRAEDYLDTGLSLQHINEIKKNFDYFDLDKDGNIDPKCTFFCY